MIFNYKLDNGVGKNNVNANALRGYDQSRNDAPKNYVERNDDLYHLTPSGIGAAGDIAGWVSGNDTSNATTPANQKDGLNKFFSTHAPDLGISAGEFSIDPKLLLINSLLVLVQEADLIKGAKAAIDNNRPIILTMLNYNNIDASSNTDSGLFIKGQAHTVVAYGYRIRNKKTEFLCHSGWGDETELWFSAISDLSLFLYGYSYIDAPLESRFNYTVYDNADKDGAVRINSLRYQHNGPLTIPAKIDGMPVIEIKKSAFSSAAITSLAFEKNSKLEIIGDFAFANSQMDQIEIPYTVTSIGSSAFTNCANLTSVSFEDNLVDIPDQMIEYQNFTHMRKLLNFDLVADVTYTLSFDYNILNSTTSTMYMYTEILVGETSSKFTRIHFEPFEFGSWISGRRVIEFSATADMLTFSKKLSCDFIGTWTNQDVSVEISNVSLQATSLLKIGSAAFWSCPQLSQITIPESVTSVGLEAFACSNNVMISVASEKQMAKWGNISVWNAGKRPIVFMDTEEVLMENTLLYHINGDGSVRLEDYYGAISSIEIPSSIVFEPSLVNHPVRAIGEGAFADCTSLTTVSFGSSLEFIGDFAFKGCVNLTGVRLPASIKEIGNSAFQGCVEMAPFYFLNTPYFLT